MDGHRFDSVTRRLAKSSRRSLLKGAIALAFGGLIGNSQLGEVSAARKTRRYGQTCRGDGDCPSGMPCATWNDGRKRCGCNGIDDCPSDLCYITTCAAGICGLEPINCDDGNFCTVDSCDPATGQCLHENKADDTSCDDVSACTTGDTCQAGVCTGTPIECSRTDGVGRSNAVCNDGTCVCPADTTKCQITFEPDDRFACCAADETCQVCGLLFTPTCLKPGFICVL